MKLAPITQIYGLGKPAPTPRASVVVAIAARRRSGIGTHDVVINPLGHQPACFIDRGFGVMDAVQRRAGTESVHVDIAVGAQLAIGRYDRPLASPPNKALISSHANPPDANHSQAGEA